ncbi:cation diffusion facilitator family transporter [Pseudobutyrivibrio xylanivorans]|uniref:Cation diffusion facilitator family transporter n=1 Tax=Pseudobutyrivibrio xylanivorans DSM 14809 TaxID=1123012 RepID=A0A1M6DCG7_PSEXY|nr:cation diffusion facilitator family transporter [Pseudobutyrivibrio xylanivorans]SHI70738.1 cation diffusion facilitator family transporter [Pseudobutyrivibrio xylanivorans DSM 14809]
MKNTNMNVADAVDNRNHVIVRTSIIGIVANLLLAGFKALVGLLSGSIAIILDAVNNLSDALSSVVTIIGTKLAGKMPDKEHPMGHGRAEYLSALLVSAIIIYAGLTSLNESILKIIHPSEVQYETLTLVVLIAAIFVKFFLGRYVKATGEKVNSSALIASGADASFDAIISTSVLASAIIYLVFGVSLEAWVGVLISVIIVKAGWEMMSDTLDDILGRRPDRELTVGIKRLICEEPEVRGAYDLVLNNYGPNKFFGSVHVELPDTMTVEEVDVITRRIQAKVFKETGVVLSGVGVYSYNTKDDEAARIRNRVLEIVKQHDWALQLHGFYVNTETKEMRFDVVLSFEINHTEGVEIIHNQVLVEYPEYDIQIAADVDVAD